VSAAGLAGTQRLVTILNAAGETLATVSITVPQPDAANDITGQDFDLNRA
jgi:hypothetical protein